MSQEPSKSNLPGGPRTVWAGATVAAAVAVSLSIWEPAPNRGEVYIDLAGKPTVCDGLTHWFGKPLDPKKHYSHAECNAMLASDLQGRQQDISKCNLPLDKMPTRVQFAGLHFAYNVGTHALCTSNSVAAHWRRGDFSAGCNGMRKWTWITSPTYGKINCRDPKWACTGLPNRRDYEADVCLGVIDWRLQPWGMQ